MFCTFPDAERRETLIVDLKTKWPLKSLLFFFSSSFSSFLEAIFSLVVTFSLSQSLNHTYFANILTYHISATSHSHLSQISAKSQPHLSHISATSQLHLSHISATSQPHLSQISAKSHPYLSQITAKCQPHLSQISTTSQSYLSHILGTSKSHKVFSNLPFQPF